MIKYELSRYDEYKDSGVEWLGDVPEHWVIKRVKDLALLQSGTSIVSEQIDVEDSYPVYGGNGLRGYYSCYTNNGDHILIGRQGALCGNINYAHGKFWASEHAVVAYLKNRVVMKWYGEMLKVMNLNQYSLSAAQPGLAIDRIKRLLLPVPPFHEQKTIANYLDTKTTQIDRNIDLLTQKATKYGQLKQSLINETVTRGLDKTVSMKDSGVEWIGEVPDHWEIYRCKDLVDYYNYYPIGDGDHGSIKPEMYVETGIPYIRVQNLSWNGKISLENIACITEDVHNVNKKSRLLIDDILVAKTGATVGKLGLITAEIKEANTTSSVGKITVNKKCFNPRFILYSFMAESFQKQIWITASQKSAQPGFNIDQFIFFAIACPKTKIEQKDIADYLDTKTAHIDHIIKVINTQIDKLKELRKTLINDVVTGKIKVCQKGETI